MTSLDALPGLQRGEPLSKHTTYRLGGPAEYFITARSADDCVKALDAARADNQPWFMLGRGSNVLFSDQGFPGLVIDYIAKTVQPKPGNKLWAEGGISLGALANDAFNRGLVGLEFAPSIPGSLGGAVRGNAGCWGREMKDIVETVDVYTPDGERAVWTNEDCHFAYRHSIFKEQPAVVLAATLQLATGDIPVARAQMLAWVKQKNINQPTTMKSAGCVFKNPPADISGGRSAGMLVEAAGLKGKQIGGMQVSERHGNFLVNTGTGTAEEAIMLISLIKQKVRVQFGIQLQEEIQLVGV